MDSKKIGYIVEVSIKDVELGAYFNYTLFVNDPARISEDINNLSSAHGDRQYVNGDFEIISMIRIEYKEEK